MMQAMARRGIAVEVLCGTTHNALPRTQLLNDPAVPPWPAGGHPVEEIRRPSDPGIEYNVSESSR